VKDQAFDSSDAARGAGELPHARTLTLDGPLPLRLGGELPEVRVCYETYGTLNAARDNAVYICHALSGDSHVARHETPAGDDAPGWWDIAVGPGRAIATDRFFVICANVLGGCRGTTGPSSIDPRTGRPYGGDFPRITVADMVEVQRRLLDALGIETLHAVSGGSMGGMMALSWAVEHPERVRRAVLLATTHCLSSQALSFDIVGRNAIFKDPHYFGGQYYDQEQKPDHGLAIARILKIPVHGTDHTAFPQYVRMFTEDPAMENAAWRYMRWFYGQMDAIYAPSRSTAQDLAERGIDASRIVVHPRGVDAERFSPERDARYFEGLGLGRQFKLLYVGRVSREKSLDVLAEAFREVHACRPDARLVVVGDGPYLEEMRAQTADLPVLFTGYLQGEALTAAYAGADLFVFPSATDTFGNVVLEAQASGLPVVVTSAGGPREAMLPGRTGLVVPPGDARSLALAVLELALDRQRLDGMATEARRFAASVSFDQAFLKTWDIYTRQVRGRAA